MTKIKILLIEDNPILRDGIAEILTKTGNFEVVARSEDGDSIRHLKSLKAPPDIVLLDLGLEKIDSLNLMAMIQEELPETRIVAMDILPDHVDIVEFVKAGGSGFILKDATVEDYIETIIAVAKGQKVLPRVLTKSLFTQIVEAAIKGGADINEELFQLTSREREVIALISEGLGNKEIAQRLNIATYTVKSHVHNILEKLALSTRLQIANFAYKKGLE